MDSRAMSFQWALQGADPRGGMALSFLHLTAIESSGMMVDADGIDSLFQPATNIQFAMVMLLNFNTLLR